MYPHTRVPRKKVQQNVVNIRFIAPAYKNYTMLIHSMEAAIGEVGSKHNLRKAIKQAKKDQWVFKRSLDHGAAGVP